MFDLFGIRRRIFIGQMADRFIERGGFPIGRRGHKAARAYATNVLEGSDIAFGASGYDWSRVGAQEMADVDLSYWD